MSRNEDKERFVIDTLEAQVKKHRRGVEPGQSRVDQFALMMNEIFPLVSEAMAHPGGFEEKKARLISTVSTQQKIADELSENWCIDQEKLLGGSSRSLLGRKLSEMIVDQGVENHSPGIILDMCTLIDDVVSGHPFVRKIAMDVGTLDSDDVLVSLRLSSFPGLFKVRSLFKKIGMDGDDQENHLNSVFSAAIALSRDVAYNYDPAGTIWDRERLFIGALPHCIDFCFEAWCDLASNELTESLINDDVDVLVSKLELTKAAVEEVNMGYDNIVSSQKDLFYRLIAGVSAYLNEIDDKAVGRELSLKIKAHKLSVIDEVLSESWMKALDSLINRFEAMTEEDKEAYLQATGDSPMDLSELWEIVHDRLSSSQLLLPEWTFDQSDIIDVAGKRLVALWGMADSLCKVKKVSA